MTRIICENYMFYCSEIIIKDNFYIELYNQLGDLKIKLSFKNKDDVEKAFNVLINHDVVNLKQLTQIDNYYFFKFIPE